MAELRCQHTCTQQAYQSIESRLDQMGQEHYAGMIRIQENSHNCHKSIEARLENLEQVLFQHHGDTIEIQESLSSCLGRFRCEILESMREMVQQLAIPDRQSRDISEATDNPGRAWQQENSHQALTSRVSQLSADKKELEAGIAQLRQENKDHVAKIMSLQAHRDELLPNAASAVSFLVVIYLYFFLHLLPTKPQIGKHDALEDRC